MVIIMILLRRSLAPTVFRNIRRSSSSRRRIHFVMMHLWMSTPTRIFLLVDFHSVCVVRRIIRSLMQRRRLLSNDNVRSVRPHRPAAAGGGAASRRKTAPSTSGALQ